MTTPPPRLCDECGQREPVVIDIGDHSLLCEHCIADYDPEFRATWFRHLPETPKGGSHDHTH
jgi:hypothetical protein